MAEIPPRYVPSIAGAAEIRLGIKIRLGLGSGLGLGLRSGQA